MPPPPAAEAHTSPTPRLPRTPPIRYNARMWTKLDHVGIAVQALAASIPGFEAALGVRATPPEEVADQAWSS
jgi:hypothetical protein